MLLHSLGMSIDGVYIGRALGWDVEICGVLWSQSLSLRPALHKFQHPAPKRAQYAPHQWTRPNYGAKKQLATPLDTLLPIPEEGKCRIQNIIGTFLYYVRAMDCTMLPSLNTLAEKQSSPTKNMEAAITYFLDYVATNPSAIIQYKTSDMILHIYSDASYLSDPRACSRTRGHYYLSSLPTDLKISKPPATSKYPNLNGMQNPQARGGIHCQRRSRRTVP